MLTISIVSHGHAELLCACLQDIADFPEVCCVVLTLNIPEIGLRIPAKLTDKIVIVENLKPLGFGANHNAAFARCETPYFCVLNPDIRFSSNPFIELLQELNKHDAAVIAPAVLAPDGTLEDSIRHFPTPLTLIMKAIGWSDGRYHYRLLAPSFAVDWVGGMFMLFRAENYRRIGGFDERFFLYYEDVDICTRLWKTGQRVLACPKAQVIHDARRASRHNFRYKCWHANSLVRYLIMHWLRMPNVES